MTTKQASPRPRTYASSSWVAEQVLDHNVPVGDLIEEYQRRHLEETGKHTRAPYQSINSAVKGERLRRERAAQISATPGSVGHVNGNGNGNGYHPASEEDRQRLIIVQTQISTRKPELKLFRIEELKGAPFQPERRYSRQRMQQLRESILQLGFVIYPPVVSADGHILDGHRRVRVMKELGVKECWCLVVPTGIAETFVQVNTSHEKFTGRDWVQGIAMGIPPTMIPGEQGRRAQELDKLAGEEIFQVLMDNKISVAIIRTSDRIAKKIELDDTDGRLRTLKWLIRFDAQKRANDALADEAHDALRTAIMRNLPLMKLDGEWEAG